MVKTCAVLLLPACTTRNTARTRKTAISDTPRMVPSRADVRMPYQPAARMITAPASDHGHHRFAGYPWNSELIVDAVVNPSCSSTSGGISQPTRT